MLDRLISLMQGATVPTVLILALITVTAVALRPQRKSLPTQQKFDESQYPIVDESDSETASVDPKERSNRQVKAQRFRMQMPVTSDPGVGVAAAIHHWAPDFPALPISESTAIIVGDAIDAKANLSEDKQSVYSDFKFKTVAVLKDACGVAKENSLITASRYGGRVRFPNGHTQLIFMSGLGMPRIGQRYVLFLKQTNADFDLLTAYALSAGKVFPLDSGTPNFSVYENVDESDFLKTIQESIGSPLKLTCN